MHRRFGGARPVAIRAPTGETRAFVAAGLRLRLLGLMRVPAGEIEPFLFPGCGSLHTFWMKTPIDLAWLDLDLGAGTATVLGVLAPLSRRSTTSAPAGLSPEVRRRVGALELPPGDASRLGLEAGSKLELAPAAQPGLRTSARPPNP